MKFASRNNYVFDESYFDFESIQTRIQSYYNTSINAESKQSPNKKQKQQQQQQRPTKTNTSNDSTNNALSLKPVYNEGDKVYAAYWWPNQDCLWYAAVITGRHRHTSGGDTKKYGPRHTYDLEYETTEIKYNGLEEEWVFSKEDYLLTTYKANDQEWIGVKNVQDKRSKDGWARLVGWYEADILDGTRQKFTFLAQALRAYDQSVVRMKGCRTQKSDLNIVEDWFFSDHPWRDPPTLIRDDAMSPSCIDIEDGSTADCGSNGASSSTDQQDKSNVEFALGIDFSKDSEEADLADAEDWGRSMFGSYNDETIDLTESRDSDSDCSDVDDECYVISPLSEDDKTTSHDNLSTDVPQRLVHTKAPANCDADLEIQSNEESPKEASPLVAKMVAAEPSVPEPDSSNACNTWSGVFSSTNELKMPRLPVAKKVPRFSATCEVVLESFNDNESMKKVCPYVTPLSLGLSHDSSSNTSTVIKEQKTVDFVKKDPQKVPRRSVPASSHGHVEDSSKKTSFDSSESGGFTDKMSKEEATPLVAKMNAAKSPGPEPDCSTTCNEWAGVFSSTNELKMARPRAVLERLFDSSTSRKSSCTTPLSSTTSPYSSTIASLQNSDNFVRKVPQKVPRRSFPASSARYVENSPGKSHPCVMIESGGSTDKMTEDYMIQSTVDTSKSPQKVSCGSEPSTCGVSQLVVQNLDLHEEAPRIITIDSNDSSSDISLASSKKSLASSKGKGRRTGSTGSRCWADHCFKFTRSKRERSEQTQTNSTSNPQVGMLSMGTKKFPRRSVADNQDTHCGESSRIPQKVDMCMKYFEQWQECDQHRGDAVENSPKLRNWIVKQQIMHDSLKSDEKSKLNSGNAFRRKVIDASVETNLSAGHSSATYSERKSLKPILEIGDSVVVVSCPSSDSNLCQTGYSATVKDRTKVRNKGQYGDVWQYDVITGDGGVIHNLEESCVFPKRDHVLSSLKKDAKDWIGVKRVRDADSIDLWARDVGWYAALVNGRYHHFPLLADALRVRDDFVVKLNGRRTKESDLNIPEEWTLPKQQGGKGPTYIGIDDKKPPCLITDPDCK